MPLTLNLTEAAHLLHVHPKTLQQRARLGLIPACKVGRSWVFVEILLIEHLVAESRSRVSVADAQEKPECRSTEGKTRPIGGSSCRPSLAKPGLYASLLGLTPSAGRRSSTTGSKQNAGSRTSSERSPATRGRTQS
ncbi:helix-turn-helix domain-containing protein [Ramlibacter sp. MAH-25]|uniref:Helix-turn-helix domain-containing protein n=1 Tax=Ramlibacter pinisoli TaxID=2682844 RepID=A0A6N8IX84_9BURK|nr:helix-turn-helix domain-containing protein [Ramlibacter pinisoli]